MNRLKTAIVTGVVALATLVPVTPTQGHGQAPIAQAQTAVTTCLNGWDNWYSFFGPNWGSGTWCGVPEDGYWRTASQDGGSDGMCVGIWASYSLTDNKTFRLVPGTLVCGYGYVGKSQVRSTVVHRLRVVATNRTGTAWYRSYEFYNSTR